MQEALMNSKNYFFFMLSTLAFIVSLAALVVESIFDFALSTTLNTVYGTSTKQYQINKLYDGKLADKAARSFT